ncbi:tRNA (uracil-5-)-methyltransferase homolog A-like [Daphnia carinata]|uniref:tRNA (uracil-5-)-methyltransferase homolog A-like n=1 Tax=Daphnia carinata TaxID=120202 RepID=UPI00257B0F6B|nr:tRNA (uracil-5-)-methyltransferase homolog A-like [Daphnia carinata]
MEVQEVVSKTEEVEPSENILTEPELGCNPENQIVANMEKPEVDEKSTAEPESGNQEEQENSENNSSDKNLDPYAYLKRPEFSSENFKVEIMNLPKFYGAGHLKKFLQKQEINANKMKLMKGYVFASFRSERERDIAMEKLKGVTYKGNILDVKLAKPMQDPLIKKRKAEADAEGQKKAKKEPKGESLPIVEQITKKTVPYAGKPYSEQLTLKHQDMMTVLKKLTKEVRNAHSQAGSFIQKKKVAYGAICELAEIIPSPVSGKYRNKCEFTVGVNPETDELTLGFRVSTYKEGSYAVGPVSHLAFISDAMREIVSVFEAHFRASGRKPYNPEDHSGFWRQVLVRTNLAGEVLAVVQVHPQNLSVEELESVKNDLNKVAEANKVVSLYFEAAGPKKPGEDPPLEHVMGSTHLIEKLCGLEFSISPLAFFQVNTLAAEVLFNKIAEIAEIDSNTNILDVCCGTGTIGLSLAKKCKRVYGVELVESAVEDAKKNAEKNGITNCVFIAGKAEDEVNNLLDSMKKMDAAEGIESSKIVAILDPPRAGLHRKCCQLLRSAERIERLIYISCNAQAAMKSFIDLCRAQSNAYAGIPFIPVKAMAVDLFPDTPHCEFILVLERYRPT